MKTKKRILITVKTYPSISKKYDELVCTAGFDEQGNWIRIYPIPFRKLEYEKQYQKYHWIKIDLVKNKSDFRPESYRPRDIDSEDLIDFGERLGTGAERRAFHVHVSAAVMNGRARHSVRAALMNTNCQHRSTRRERRKDAGVDSTAQTRSRRV